MPWKVVSPNGMPAAAVARMPISTAADIPRAASAAISTKARTAEQASGRLVEVPQRHQGGGVGHHDTHVLQPDHGQEKPDARPDAEL